MYIMRLKEGRLKALEVGKKVDMLCLYTKNELEIN